MLEIIPSVLSSDVDEARSLVTSCEGITRRVHIDIIDGVYANNKTIDPSIFTDFETSLLIDYHLMVKEPISWIEKCIQSGGERIIAQIEMMASQEEFVNKVLEVGLAPGLALDLKTPLTSLNLDSLAQVDTVLVMSVPAGFGNQPFDEDSLVKIEELNDLKQKYGYTFTICDDGGITLDTISLTKSAGVDEVAIGRRIFNGDLATNIDNFKRVAMR